MRILFHFFISLNKNRLCQTPLASLGVGPTGDGKEGGDEGKRRDGREGTGREGRASRNAQIQSWQAYII